MLKLPLVVTHLIVMLLILSRSAGSILSSTPSTTNSSTSIEAEGHFIAFGYELDVPAAAQIDGIELQLNASASDHPGLVYLSAALSWDGGTTWTQTRRTPALAAGELTYALGGTDDTWGRSWARSDLARNGVFRVRIAAIGSGRADVGDVGLRIGYRSQPDLAFHPPRVVEEYSR